MGSEFVPTTLGEVVASGGGAIQTGPFGSQLHASDYVDEGIPVIMPVNISDNRVDLTDIARITEEDANRLSRHIVKKGDIIYSRRGDVTRKALITEAEDGMFCGTGCLLVRPGTNIDPRFLTYHLSSPGNQEWIIRHAIGATMPNLNTGILADVPLRVPSPAIQKSIAHILGTLDDKIELNRRMNATLEAMAQALFKSWFVDFDPVIDNALAAGNPIPEPLHAKAEARKALGDNRKPLPEAIQQQFPSRFVFSEEMGWIPEGWEVSSVGDFCEVIDCLHSKKPAEVDKDTGNILLQLNNIRNDGLLDLGKKFYISDDDYRKWISRIEVKEGDCVITNVGRVGAVSIVPSGVFAAIGRNMTAIRLRKGNNLRSFMITLLSNPWMTREIERRTDVGTILNALNVKSVPKLGLLDAGGLLTSFEKKCYPMLKKRQNLLEENLSLANIRDTLLPKLLSGEFRIPDAERLVEDAV